MSDLPKYERVPAIEHDDVELGYDNGHVAGQRAGGGGIAAGTSTSTLTPRQAVTSYSVRPLQRDGEI